MLGHVRRMIGRDPLSSVAYPLLLSLISVTPLWVFRYVPMTDAPNHLLAAFIIVHYHDPRFSFPAHFTLDLTPRSNIFGHYIMIALLRLGLSPETTLRVFASLIVLTTIWGLYALMRALRGSSYARFWFPLGIPLAYTWFFNQGFLNFSFSVGLGLFTLALGVHTRIWLGERKERRSRDYLLLTLLAYVTYLAHALGLALVMTGVAGFALGEIGTRLLRRGGLRRAAAYVGRALTPFLILGGLVILSGKLSPNAGGEAGAFLTPPFIVWVPLSKKIAELRYGLLNYTPRREQFILLPMAIIYLVGWVASLRRPRIWHLPAPIAFVAYVILPMGFWVPFFIYERFWLFTLLLGALALPNLTGGVANLRGFTARFWSANRARVLAAVVFILLLLPALLFLVNLTNDYRIANRYLRDYDRVLDALPDGATAFPFTYHQQGRLSPARHFWAYAMMRKDVFIPMVFAESYHPVQYRPTVARPYPLHYEDGFFAEHAHNRATLWVREDDPLMQKVTLPKIGRHGFVRVGQIGPYGIYQLHTWPAPVPPEARPHIRPDVVAAYSHLLVFGYPPAPLVQEIERFYRLKVQWGLARGYERVVPPN